MNRPESLVLDLVDIEIEPLATDSGEVFALESIDGGTAATEMGASLCATSCCSCCLGCCCCCW